ncbi:MAG: CcoQ/FixQ family Cbb3-type cytochrome c oxidase assembly chaperone [Cryomorphaceae bacterium]|nr:CcoQ/FixQ family Cbb3-type cytochrome c oxidase assembly chaperone [Cryomorphaceae bacterium]
MFKFIKGHMETMANIEWYPILSLLIFFTFFAIMVVRVVMMRKEEYQSISKLPLDDEPQTREL